MADATAAPEQGKPSDEDPRVRSARALSGGDKGLENVLHAAQGAELDEEEEGSALDYVLGAPKPVVHDITVQFETDKGMRPLTFVVQVRDVSKIDAIEMRNLDQGTGQVDRLTADCEIVAECALMLLDGKRQVRLNSEEFLTVRRRGPGGEIESFTHVAVPDALRARFRSQLGLINGVALQIKRVCGFTPDRVGQAKRRLVEASLG